jgi:hypothetical protein
MKRILHFKNPSLTKQEYDFILNCFVEITEEDFDQAEWQDVKVYMFMTDGLEVRLCLNDLEYLSEEFDSVTITDEYVYIKNKGEK